MRQAERRAYRRGLLDGLRRAEQVRAEWSRAELDGMDAMRQAVRALREKVKTLWKQRSRKRRR